jgi:hypothetical protein
MYFVQMDIIMCGENLGKNSGKKSLCNGQTWWWQCNGVGIHGSIKSGKSSFYRRQHKQTCFVNIHQEHLKASVEKLGILP